LRHKGIAITHLYHPDLVLSETLYQELEHVLQQVMTYVSFYFLFAFLFSVRVCFSSCVYPMTFFLLSLLLMVWRSQSLYTTNAFTPLLLLMPRRWAFLVPSSSILPLLPTLTVLLLCISYRIGMVLCFFRSFFAFCNSILNLSSD